MASVKKFICEYTRAVSEGYADVFAGAGLSRGSGYINWKELISKRKSYASLWLLKEKVKINNKILCISTSLYQQKIGAESGC